MLREARLYLANVHAVVILEGTEGLVHGGIEEMGRVYVLVIDLPAREDEAGLGEIDAPVRAYRGQTRLRHLVHVPSRMAATKRDGIPKGLIEERKGEEPAVKGDRCSSCGPRLKWGKRGKEA